MTLVAGENSLYGNSARHASRRLYIKTLIIKYKCFGFPRVINMTHVAGIKIEYLNSVQLFKY